MQNDFTMKFRIRDTTGPLSIAGVSGACIEIDTVFVDPTLQPLASDRYGTRVQRLVYTPNFQRWKRTEFRVSAIQVDWETRKQFPTWQRTGWWHSRVLIMVNKEKDPGVLELIKPILAEERERMYLDLAQLDTAVTEARRLDRDQPL